MEGYELLKKAIELILQRQRLISSLPFITSLPNKKKKRVEVMEQALKIDPLSPIINQYLGDTYVIAGRPDDALQLAEKLLDLHPHMRATLEMKGWCMGAKGDWKKAIEIFEEVYRLTNHPLKGLTPLAFAYGQTGEKEKALECIRKIESGRRKIQML